MANNRMSIGKMAPWVLIQIYQLIFGKKIFLDILLQPKAV